MRRYSVLMSVYAKERSDYLDLAIQSMLSQSLKPTEFVIVCDGPLPKELNDILDKYLDNKRTKFKYIRLKENVGLGSALAIGIHHCEHEWIARMDSDDYCFSTRIEKQMNVLDCNPSIGMIGTNVAEFFDDPNDEISKVTLPETNEEIIKYSRRRCAFRHPSLLFRKQEVLNAGNYSSKFYLFEDMDLLGRMIANGCVCHNVQEYLTRVRISRDFYKRRGGVKYLAAMVSVKWMLVEIGVSSIFDFLISAGGQSLVCVMPNKLRQIFYMKFLRG